MSVPSEDPDAAAFSVDNWCCLIEYYLSCIQREDLFRQPLPSSGRSRRFLLNPTLPELLVGRGLPTAPVLDDEDILDRVHDIVEKGTQPGRAVYYGYPCVLVIEPDADRPERGEKLYLYPLFYLQVSVERGQDGVVLHALEPEAAFNAPALRGQGLKAENQADLSELLDQRRTELTEESADDILRALVSEICELTGLPVQENPEPTRLSAQALSSLRETGLYNLSMLFYGQRTDFVQGLVSELEELKTAAWFDRLRDTAVAALFNRLPDLQLRKPEWYGAIVPMNDWQMDAVEQAFQKRLTVVTGPPGTGKSQLVLNVLCNCLLHGQKVLFASTNNSAVDVVVRKLEEDFPGSIVRTGAREQRQKAADLLGELLQRAVNRPFAESDQIIKMAKQAYRQLDLVKGLIDALAKLDQLLEGCVVRYRQACSAIAQRETAQAVQVAGPKLARSLCRATGAADALLQGRLRVWDRCLTSLWPGYIEWRARRIISAAYRAFGLLDLASQVRKTAGFALQLHLGDLQQAAAALDSRRETDRLLSDRSRLPPNEELAERLATTAKALLSATSRATQARQERNIQALRQAASHVRSYLSLLSRPGQWHRQNTR